MHCRQNPNGIGDHAVIELDGERVFEQIAPRWLDEPQPFPRRHESIVNKRPSVENESGIKAGDERTEINLKQQKARERERLEAQTRRSHVWRLLGKLLRRPQDRPIDRGGERQMKPKAVLRDTDALRETRRDHPPASHSERGPRAENRPQSHPQTKRNVAAPDKKQ